MQKDIRSKLKLIGQGIVQQIILDVLSLAEQEITNEELIDTEGMVKACVRYIKIQQNIYKAQIKEEEERVQRNRVTVQTRDLESLIISIKDGTEPPLPWISKNKK